MRVRTTSDRWDAWGRWTFLLMLPVGVFLAAWVWIGRLFFGSGGWFMLLFFFSVLPVMLIGVLVAWLVAMGLPRPRRLDPGQTVAQWVTWGGALALGLFVVDFGDTDDSVGSVFSRALGNSGAVQTWSMLLAIAAALLTAVAWVVLLVLLFRRRSSAAARALAQPPAGPVTGAR